jgi:hypothetical protein
MTEQEYKKTVEITYIFNRTSRLSHQLCRKLYSWEGELLGE